MAYALNPLDDGFPVAVHSWQVEHSITELVIVVH